MWKRSLKKIDHMFFVVFRGRHQLCLFYQKLCCLHFVSRKEKEIEFSQIVDAISVADSRGKWPSRQEKSSLLIKKFCTLRLRWIFIFISIFFQFTILYGFIVTTCGTMRKIVFWFIFLFVFLFVYEMKFNQQWSYTMSIAKSYRFRDLWVGSIVIGWHWCCNFTKCMIFTIRQKETSIYLRLTVQLVNCNLNWKKHHFIIIWSFCRKIVFIDV